MLLLHAAFCGGHLSVWGECAPPSRASRNGLHPFSADAKSLAEGLGLPARRVRTRAVAWLPSAGANPLPSSPLIGEPPPSRKAPALAPWVVPVLRLNPRQALDVLASCDGRNVLRPGVVVGDDLAYWTRAMQFAGALVARQQFLPDVAPARAFWKPVLAGADVERFAGLAEAMPSACRALTEETAIEPPSEARRAVLSAFMGSTVDALVRSAAPPEQRPSFETIHDEWAYALRSENGAMAEQPGFDELAAAVCKWQRPVAITANAPYRLCFRLEEPANGDPWHIAYLLQAAHDPSLLVSAADALRPGKKKALAAPPGFDFREYLLVSLGQASSLCPPVEASLKAAVPEACCLDATAAHRFLTEEALLLQQSGFGVLLPAWWTRKGTKLHLSARAKVRSPKLVGGSGMSLDAVVDFDWQAALGDETLTRKELEELAALKAPLVKVRGQWVELNPDEIRAALDFWKKQAGGRATAREIVRMALGGVDAPGGLEFSGMDAEGWIADLLSQLDGRCGFQELPVPTDFHGVLRPYQARGYSWLGFLRQWGLGACLADDMGLGKTVQTLALIQREREAGVENPFLLIAPTSVVGNWLKEAARFTPGLPVLVHHGVARQKGAAFRKEAARYGLVLSSYALLHRDFEILKDVPWAGVILDEAQNIKNAATRQAQAARALPAGCRIALTGTPVENNVGDLWSIFEFLNPGFLGSQAQFKKSFFMPIQVYRDRPAAERLKRLTAPFLLRRLKTDKSVVSDLPEKMEMKVFCNLTKEQATLYQAVVKDSEKKLEEAEGISRKGVILALLSKLKQVCNHPAQFLGDNSAVAGRSGKLARLTEMLEEVREAGERALIFSQFAEMGEILRRHLQESFGCEALFLHGGVPKKQRDRMVERFQQPGGPPFFILSLKAGGTGLNLTEANHVFHFDRWWNPAVENQATDRAFRIGQTRNVQVHKYLCVGTLEERIDEMIERKQEIAGQVVGAGEGWLTELSNRQLKELFALRKEAVGE